MFCLLVNVVMLLIHFSITGEIDQIYQTVKFYQTNACSIKSEKCLEEIESNK